MLRSVDRVLTDVSGQPIGPILAAGLLNMGSIGFPETSATNYQYTLRDILEERTFHPITGFKDFCGMKLRGVSFPQCPRFIST